MSGPDRPPPNRTRVGLKDLDCEGAARGLSAPPNRTRVGLKVALST